MSWDTTARDSRRSRESPFHDKAQIRVQAGRGGDGSLHFRREKHVPKGGPDGGDGGPGGDVALLADADLRDLSGFRTRRHLRAGNGEPGRGSLKHGASGESLDLRVPVGTQVFDDAGQLIADLASPGAHVILARGGSGGRGNKRFATPTTRTPRFAETGTPGEEATLELRLKLLADAALAGLPNAGKSSLLARISNARPKVADYPFTTIAPVLGTVDSPDGARQLTVADVPGLIEGASKGAGLGHEFLAHLERARLLLHVIDASGDDAEERWRTVDDELTAYGADLELRPQAVVLNKIDLRAEPPAFAVADERIVRVFRTSCATGAGVEELKRALFELCLPIPPPPADEDGLVDFLVYRPRATGRAFRVLRTDRGFRIAGERPADEAELEAALKNAGARAGDEVEVGGDVLELQ
jgi:GTPase